MYNPKELEIRFSVALVRLLRNFNLLDWNLGLCISQYVDLGDSSSASYEVADWSMHQKLQSLERIARDAESQLPTALRPQLVSWVERADKARGTRNKFAHGHWELLPLSEDAPVRLHAPPWMRKRLDLHTPMRMKVDELDEIADEMEELVREFLAMRSSVGW